MQAVGAELSAVKTTAMNRFVPCDERDLEAGASTGKVSPPMDISEDMGHEEEWSGLMEFALACFRPLYEPAPAMSRAQRKLAKQERIHHAAEHLEKLVTILATITIQRLSPSVRLWLPWVHESSNVAFVYYLFAAKV